ncbi:hypothetical protein [Leptothermofonsia sichuanensis]|uniref:hypothetical protein n=1 Tax=Leptothermofonsia sichuanensis TaxID=2917832 RepID=UPI001CEDE371|nr:hypothetical protein [Leptothermofonsia sichuanensis]
MKQSYAVMTPSDLEELANQGDTGAIAALLAQVVRGRGIVVRVHQREDCLHILLEADLVPDQVAAVRLIRKRLVDLGLAIARTVRIYGRQRGETKPAWTVAFELVKPPGSNPDESHPAVQRVGANRLSSPGQKSLPGTLLFQIGQFTYTTGDLQNLLTRLDPMKVAFVVVLALYGLFGASSYTVERFLEGGDRIMMFLHGVNLIFHEAGHVIFAIFGRFLHILGGSLMQFLVPAGIAGYFFFHRQLYASAVTLCWAAQNLWDVSIYIKDAQERALPLLGGEAVLHDWHFLLLDLNLLTQDQLIGNLVFWIGTLLYLAAILAGLYYAQIRCQSLADNP